MFEEYFAGEPLPDL